jgi:hypothetical protein
MTTSHLIGGKVIRALELRDKAVEDEDQARALVEQSIEEGER